MLSRCWLCPAAGLAETLVRAAEAVHPDLHGLLYSNVLLTGAQRGVGGS